MDQPLRVSLGAGIIIAVLAPFVVYLLGIGHQNLFFTFFEIFLLVGIWIIISSFYLSEARAMYLIIGILLALISSAFVVPLTYAAALILIGVIAAVIVGSTMRKS
jgi:hypothetical protein